MLSHFLFLQELDTVVYFTKFMLVASSKRQVRSPTHNATQ